MSSRYVYGIGLLLTLTAGYACWCRAPMIWDGAYQFNATLIMQRPYFYLTRFHTFFLWWPTVWASRCTTNATLLQTVYGLPFLLAPVLAVMLSWWMVHKDGPHLIIWPIFGVAAGSLPGQIFVINDSIFQQHLFWPILMGLFVPLSAPKKIVIGILCLFQFVHPLGVLLFFGAVLAMALLAIVDRENRRRLVVRAGVMALFFALAAGKIIVTNHIPSLYDGYAADEAKLSTAIDRWTVGVRGWPLHGLWFMWSAAGMLFLATRWRGRLSESAARWLGAALAIALFAMMWEYRHDPHDAVFGGVACVLSYAFVLQFRRENGLGPLMASLPLICITAAAACWIHWAGDGRLWWKAIDYRRWVGPLTAPFFLLAVIDALPGFIDSARLRLRQPAAVLLALTFAAVLGLQCRDWHLASSRMMNEVMQYPASIVPESALPWMDGTPLDHWAVSDYVMAMQGKQPAKLLLDQRAAEHMYAEPPKIPHWDFYPGARQDHPDPTPGPAGWFDLRPLLTKLKSEPRPITTGPERLDKNSTPE